MDVPVADVDGEDAEDQKSGKQQADRDRHGASLLACDATEQSHGYGQRSTRISALPFSVGTPGRVLLM